MMAYVITFGCLYGAKPGRFLGNLLLFLDKCWPTFWRGSSLKTLVHTPKLYKSKQIPLIQNREIDYRKFNDQ